MWWFSKKIRASETKIEGKWTIRNGKVKNDSTSRRIDWLVKNCLTKIKEENWETTFCDSDDGRCWLMSYPQSHMHGGGPPCLEVVECPDEK